MTRVMFIKTYHEVEDGVEFIIDFGDEATLLDEETNEVMLDSGYIFCVSPKYFLPLREDDDVMA